MICLCQSEPLTRQEVHSLRPYHTVAQFNGCRDNCQNNPRMSVYQRTWGAFPYRSMNGGYPCSTHPSLKFSEAMIDCANLFSRV